jgi:hypothetical protein
LHARSDWPRRTLVMFLTAVFAISSVGKPVFGDLERNGSAYGTPTRLPTNLLEALAGARSARSCAWRKPVSESQAAVPSNFTIQPFANPRTGTTSSSKWKVQSRK